jgi:hypothetical protein
MPFEAHLSLLDILLPFIQRAVLIGLGVGLFVHLVCMANFMPPGNAPAVVWVPVAGGAAAAVLILHAAIFGRIDHALWAAATAAASMLFLQLVLWLRGYHVCAHLAQSSGGQS